VKANAAVSQHFYISIVVPSDLTPGQLSLECQQAATDNRVSVDSWDLLSYSMVGAQKLGAAELFNGRCAEAGSC
jgi:hypothetical protein